jgi:glycosyltransferase involved in cell wall biosynthesis
MRSTKYGGIERYFVELACRCHEHGYRLALQYNEPPRSRRYLTDLEAAGAVVVVRPFSTRRVANVLSALELMLRRRPAIVHLHFCDGWTRLVVGLLGPVLGTRRVVATTHLTPVSHSARSRALTRVSYARMDRVLCVSDSVRRDLEALGVPCRLLATQYIGVPDLGPLPPTARAEMREKLAIPAGAAVLVSILFNSRMKALDVLVDAFTDHLAPRFADLHLVIVGVPYADRLRFCPRADRCPERIHWAGITDDVRPFLAAADIYVQPSRNEAFGLAIVEAMRQALPVVATRVGGVPEVVADGVTGVLVPPDSPDELAAAAGRLLTDAGLRRRLAESGRARWETRFELGSAVEALVSDHYGLGDGGVGR